MKILHSDFRKGVVKVLVEDLDDLWYLTQIIEAGDRVKGKTLRKLKLGEGEWNVQVVKKVVFLKIQVEKAEFHQYSNMLRVSGIILEGPEDIPRGSHHTFNIEENSSITLEKLAWLQYQIEKLKEAAKEKPQKILLCVMDREEAHFALLKRQGYQLLGSIKGEVQKKYDAKIRGGDFYGQIIKAVQEYTERYQIQHIVLASPAFWNEELMKQLTDDHLRTKIILATCSSADPTAFNEVLKREETKQVLQQDRTAKEMRLVEELMGEIGKDNLAAYGFKEVQEAVNMGAVKMLLLTDNFLQQSRMYERYKEVERVMKLTEQMKGEVHIINSEHDGGKKLDGLGGIGAVLRYKIH